MFNFSFSAIVVALSLAVALLTGCGEGTCDPSLPDSDCPAEATSTPAAEVSPTPAIGTPTPMDDGDDDTVVETPSPSPEPSPTPEVSPTPSPVPDLVKAQACWDSVPFQVQYLYVNRSIATTVPGNWQDGINWLDHDSIFKLDASDPSSSELVRVYAPGQCGNDRSVEADIYLPTGFVMREPSDPLYNNGIAVALQRDGTVSEVNYLEACDDGSGAYSGWVLPDGAYQNACGLGYSSVIWLGAHGGSHATGTQAITVGELTSGRPIGRPVSFEVDHTHLACPQGATSGYDCFTGPLAASGDAYALSEYSGTIPELTMGGILVLPEDYDCEGLMVTEPGLRLCEVARDHFFFIVDDSYGEDEIAVPVEDSVPDEVEAMFGIEMHNANQGTGATQDYAMDVETFMMDILVVTNPNEAVVLAE